MTNPQQPEIGRSRLGDVDQNAFEIRAGETNPMNEPPFGKVPEENQPGHHPEHDQDKPEGPPPGS